MPSDILAVQRFYPAGPIREPAHLGKPLPDAVMRWLMFALFVSVVALLAAVAGMVRHVWQQHKTPGLTPKAGDAGSLKNAADAGSAATGVPSQGPDEEPDGS